MGLQTDADGNFYYAKAARHGKTAAGAAARHAAEGQQATAARTEILATGFRAPNGVCLNPDGTFFLTDQEGFWTPEEPDQPRQAAAASTATCGATTTSPTPPTRRWSRRSAGSPTPSTARRPSCSGSTERRLGAAEGLAAEPLLRHTARSSSCRTRPSPGMMQGGHVRPADPRRSRPA